MNQHSRSVIASLLCIILLTSCYTTVKLPTKEDYKTSLIGKTYDELVKSLGTPDDSVAKENGKKTLIYNEVIWRKDGTVYRNAANSIQQANQPMQGYLHLSMNSDNVCYNYDTDYAGGDVKVKSHGKTAGLAWGLGAGIPVLALVVVVCCL